MQHKAPASRLKPAQAKERTLKPKIPVLARRHATKSAVVRRRNRRTSETEAARALPQEGPWEPQEGPWEKPQKGKEHSHREATPRGAEPQGGRHTEGHGKQSHREATGMPTHHRHGTRARYPYTSHPSRKLHQHDRSEKISTALHKKEARASRGLRTATSGHRAVPRGAPWRAAGRSPTGPHFREY